MLFLKKMLNRQRVRIKIYIRSIPAKFLFVARFVARFVADMYRGGTHLHITYMAIEEICNNQFENRVIMNENVRLKL
jgi:hypothetical protein